MNIPASVFYTEDFIANSLPHLALHRKWPEHGVYCAKPGGPLKVTALPQEHTSGDGSRSQQHCDDQHRNGGSLA